MQNYSFFLFSRLYGLYYDTDTLPYDELFGEVVAMYENYENSAYNGKCKLIVQSRNLMSEDDVKNCLADLFSFTKK